MEGGGGEGDRWPKKGKSASDPSLTSSTVINPYTYMYDFIDINVVIYPAVYCDMDPSIIKQSASIKKLASI